MKLQRGGVVRMRRGCSSFMEKGVIPDAVVDILHGANMAVMEHIAASEDALLQVEPILRKCILKHAMTPDEHPTVTRMFTFTPCLDGVLLLMLLDAPAYVFRPSSSKPNQENQKRINKSC